MTKSAAALVRLQQPAARRQPVPPRKLGPHGMKPWKSIVSSYEFSDPGSIATLALACQGLDRAEELNEEIAKDGAVIRGAAGPRCHPAVRFEVANRAFVVSTLTKLGLDLEPLRSVRGRPPGS
jgi:hypothetical protein